MNFHVVLSQNLFDFSSPVNSIPQSAQNMQAIEHRAKTIQSMVLFLFITGAFAIA